MPSDLTLANIILICAVLQSHVSRVWSVSSSSSDWGRWSDWSTCSTECGPGIQDRTRTCLTGVCSAGSEVQTRSCLIKDCPPSQPSFRQTACSTYDKRVFSGKRYVWEPYVHSTDACKLACRAKGISFYANLPTRARDGDLCQKPGQPKAICFRGACKPVGCDDVVLSPARYDECGVCQGDGSECKTVSGVFANSQLPRGINHVITIPAGSTSINITELSPSQNQMILQGSSGKVYFNNGYSRPPSGTIQAAGTTIRYIGKTSINPRESFISTGPTNSTIYVKLMARGGIPNIQYTFSVPIEYDIQPLTLGTIQRPIVRNAPQYVKEDDATLSALHGGDHRNHEPTEKETIVETTSVKESISGVDTNPKTDSNDVTPSIPPAYSVDLNETDPDLLEASGEVGVEIIDSGEGGEGGEGRPSDVVSSYDVSIRKGGVEVLEEENDDSGEEVGSEDYDDEDDEEEEEDGNKSVVQKPVSIDKPKYKPQRVVIPRTKTLSRSREVLEYEGTHEIDVTYFNNDYSYGSASYVPGDSSEFNRNDHVDTVDTVYDTTPPPAEAPHVETPHAETPRADQNEKSFKLPKFSNSFTFASKYKFSPPQKKDKTIRLSERPHRKINTGGFGTRAVESSPTVVKTRSDFETERERAARERQAMLDERDERLRKRMEAYNKKLRDYQAKMRQRRKEAMERSYGRSRDRSRDQSRDRSRDQSRDRSRDRTPVRKEYTGGNQFVLKIDNGKTNVKVAMIPSSSSSSTSSTSTFEKSIYVDSRGNINKNPTVIRRVSSSDPNEPRRDNLHETNAGSRDVISRTKGSIGDSTNTLDSRKDITPQTDSGNVRNIDQGDRKTIPRISETHDEVSSQTPRSIISRVADNQNIRRPITSPESRKIISRLSRPDGVPTGSNFAPSGSGIQQQQRPIDRPNSRRIIRPIIRQPEYIPNERDIYTSALSGGDPSVVHHRTDGIIPNRFETPDYSSGLPATKTRIVSPPKTLSIAEEPQTFSDNEWRISGLTECTHSCGGGVQQTMVVCVDTRTQAVLTDDNCGQFRRPQVKAVTCNKRPCPARWVPSAWSSCSVTCGDGEQTRTVNCQTRVSPTLNLTMPESSCQNSETPVQRRTCSPQACSSWSVGNWSECSSDCGDGVKSRDVNCVGLDEEVLGDDECSSLKPDAQEPCNLGACGKGWFFTAWPEECPVTCGSGVLTRKVFCASEKGEALPENRCDVTNRPQTTRNCKVNTPCGGSWYTSPWATCNTTCGAGARTRDVLCVKLMPGGLHAVVREENCAGSPKPEVVLECEGPPCSPDWYTTSWGECSQSCGNGHKTRELKCLSPEQRNSDQCPLERKPKTRQHCNAQSCRIVKPPESTSLGNDGCRDKFTRCRVVKRARLCKYAYYKKLCCSSCS